MAKYEDKIGKFDSRDDEIKKFATYFKDLDKNALKLYMNHRYKVDPSNPIYKQKDAAASHSVDTRILQEHSSPSAGHSASLSKQTSLA